MARGTRILKQQATKWEKFFVCFVLFLINYTADRGLISKLYKALKSLDIKKMNNPVKKWGTDINEELSKEKRQMAKKHFFVTET